MHFVAACLSVCNAKWKDNYVGSENLITLPMHTNRSPRNMIANANRKISVWSQTRPLASVAVSYRAVQYQFWRSRWIWTMSFACTSSNLNILGWVQSGLIWNWESQKNENTWYILSINAVYFRRLATKRNTRTWIIKKSFIELFGVVNYH